MTSLSKADAGKAVDRFLGEYANRQAQAIWRDESLRERYLNAMVEVATKSVSVFLGGDVDLSTGELEALRKTIREKAEADLPAALAEHADAMSGGMETMLAKARAQLAQEGLNDAAAEAVLRDVRAFAEQRTPCCAVRDKLVTLVQREGADALTDESYRATWRSLHPTPASFHEHIAKTTAWAKELFVYVIDAVGDAFRKAMAEDEDVADDLDILVEMHASMSNGMKRILDESFDAMAPITTELDIKAIYGTA